MLATVNNFELQILDQIKHTTPLEWVGTISGFLCVYLAAKQSIWNWPVAIISVLAYSLLFYENKLYGDAVLQIYFFGTSIYGWYYWLNRKDEKVKPLVKLSAREAIWLCLAIIVLSGLMGLFLKHFTDTNVPFIDGFCTAMSFAGQLLMTRKVVQSWIIWIIVDICYVPLYLYKHLALTTLLYTLFVALATMGYLDWKRNYKKQSSITI